MNRKDAKYHGGENGTIGVEYEIRFAIKKLVEMLLPTSSGVKIVKVFRQKKEYVDDVIEEKSNQTKVFYQCKHFKRWVKKSTNNTDENSLWTDFLAQFREDNTAELVLVTQNKDPGFDDLANLAKACDDIKIFQQELNTDSFHVRALEKFTYLISLINKQNKDHFVFMFLKQLRIASHDDHFTKEDTLKQLRSFFSELEAENVFNSFHAKLNSDWLGKEIDKSLLIEELNRLGINTSKIEVEENVTDASIVPSQGSGHLFTDVSSQFSEKLDYLLKLINNDPNIGDEDVVKSLDIIALDGTLAWHFLKNLKDPLWFPKIKDNVIKTLSRSTEDSAAKFQLLNFFDLVAKEYSDEIVAILYQLERNTQSYQILSSLLRTLNLVVPKSPESIEKLWQILDDLVEHQHPWVRREIAQVLLTFVELDEDKVFALLGKLFDYAPPPQDVTQGSPTLELTFQGRDNENWVFEEATKALGKLLVDAKYAEKAHALARQIEKNALVTDQKAHDSEMGVTLDYSSIWLSDKSYESEKLEHNYDRKERIALEIEKALDELTHVDKSIAELILTKLISEQYEVFYLVAIKVLIRNTQNYPQLAQSLVFNNNLWLVYNIRNYFLQTLANAYFKVQNGEGVENFVKTIEKLQLDTPKKTQDLQQDIYVSIPEEYRDSSTESKLKKVSEALKVQPVISKPFEITTWSGIRPDVTVNELEIKTELELVQIMVDSSEGRRAGAYDTAPIFGQLISKKTEILHSLLKAMKEKAISANFAGEMVAAYKEKFPKKITQITEIIELLDDKDTWARIEIARYLNELCRKKEIQGYDAGNINAIRGALIKLSNDEHPESDNTIKSTPASPQDAITRGINSVRGITTEALIAFCHYFPNDSSVKEQIKKLSDDKTKAVQATLIFYLKYLIKDNFTLCEAIINKFKNVREAEIDFALLHFFAHLDCEQFLQYQGFIKLLFNNPDKKISEDLGELVARRYINGCDVELLLNDIIGGRRGTKYTIRSLAFVFESNMGDLIEGEQAAAVASYLRRLLNPQNDPEVIERASFVFQRDEVRPEHFDFLDKAGLMSELILNPRNISAQSHLVEYLQQCIESGVFTDRCIEVLHEQVKSVGALLSDQLIAKKIAEIVVKLVSEDLPSKTKGYLRDIFNAGLERGWDEFYAIYHSQKVS